VGKGPVISLAAAFLGIEHNVQLALAAFHQGAFHSAALGSELVTRQHLANTVAFAVGTQVANNDIRIDHVTDP
jgi:hypothetical protein